MQHIDDKANGIRINHSSDWSGEARIGWYFADERYDLGPTPPSLSECQCSARDLLAGRFTLLSGCEPPINVITRAVALAVETYFRVKMMRAAEGLFIRRDKL